MKIYKVYDHRLPKPKLITIEVSDLDRLHSFTASLSKTICYQEKDNHGMYESYLRAIFVNEKDLNNFCSNLNLRSS